MYNRYQGNTGRYVRVEEKRPPERKASPSHSGQKPPPNQIPYRKSRPLFINELSGMLKNGLGELETEDLMLLLILYLMYRESGDSELLIIMGAMFLM